MELSEKRRHTLHCALHNPDLSNCKFYQTAVVCKYIMMLRCVVYNHDVVAVVISKIKTVAHNVVEELI